MLVSSYLRSPEPGKEGRQDTLETKCKCPPVKQVGLLAAPFQPRDSGSPQHMNAPSHDRGTLGSHPRHSPGYVMWAALPNAHSKGHQRPARPQLWKKDLTSEASPFPLWAPSSFMYPHLPYFLFPKTFFFQDPLWEGVLPVYVQLFLLYMYSAESFSLRQSRVVAGCPGSEFVEASGSPTCQHESSGKEFTTLSPFL